MVMDKDKDGEVDAMDYLSYMDVLLHGTDQEKYSQSFSLLDIEGNGQIRYKDLKKVAIQVTQMWSYALGKPVETHEEVIHQLFDQLCNGKAYFDEQDYIEKMMEDPHLMDWFSKPNSVLQTELGKKVMKQDQCISLDTFAELQEKIMDHLNLVDKMVM